MTNQHTSQDDFFLNDEGDAYFQRNKKKLLNLKKETDLIYSSLVSLGLKPNSVLEIGCANGFRLNWLYEKFKCYCMGIEPSSNAIEDGRKKYPNVIFEKATFDILGNISTKFDVIILGFFVYLVPREKLFKLAYLVDSHLENGGYVISLDFFSKTPIVNNYTHRDGISSFKFDLSQMFLWNPQYVEVFRHVKNHNLTEFSGDQNESIAVTILRKNDIISSYVRQATKR